MMPSRKKENVVKSEVSSKLFVSGGKPMSFYLRPGPIKHKLVSHITSGGGSLSSVQQPGAILLVDPSERDCIPESTSHWYVSTTYIDDCVKKNQLLNLEEYRLNPKETPGPSAEHFDKLNSKGKKVQLTGGRSSYTAEEDDAILSYVIKHREQTGGNRLWQKMEKLRVTSHSWQSMKYHYRQKLGKMLSEVTKLDAEPRKAKVKEIPNLPEAEETQLVPQTDLLLSPAEDTPAQSQTTISPQKSLFPPTLVPEVQPLRRSTRRRLDVDATAVDEPRKKGRRFVEPTAESVRETTSAVSVCEEKDTTDDSAPSQRSRGDGEATVAELQQPLEDDDAQVSTGPPVSVSLDKESQSLLEDGSEGGEQRELGMLEMATKEFEDQFKTAEDDAVDVQPEVTQEKNAPLAPPPALPTGQGSTQSNPEPGPSDQVEPRLQTISPEPPEPKTPAAADAAAAADDDDDTDTHPGSRAHLFIFESGPQEADSRAVVGHRTTALSNSQPPVTKASAVSSTQLQLEEDVQEIQTLMERTDKDLYCVTKALLKTSGDFCAAFHLLMNPTRFSGPFWNRSDDSRLRSGDPVVRQQLRDKYGDAELVKRIGFLELER